MHPRRSSSDMMGVCMHMAINFYNLPKTITPKTCLQGVPAINRSVPGVFIHLSMEIAD